jgi:3-aminobutyryl-CoA ammonia-lyase
MSAPDATLRVRLGTNDTHYGGYLVPAATVLRLFADCSTQIGLKENGRPGLLAAYEKAEFLAPLHVGDYLEIRATVLSRGNRSRRVGLEALRFVRAPVGENAAGGWQTLEAPELVARATMVSVRPK